jgi:hypothetical protein
VVEIMQPNLYLCKLKEASFRRRWKLWRTGARDLSSVLSAKALATAEGLAKEDSEVRIARERASYTGHLTGSRPRVNIVIFA